MSRMCFNLLSHPTRLSKTASLYHNIKSIRVRKGSHRGSSPFFENAAYRSSTYKSYRKHLRDSIKVIKFHKIVMPVEYTRNLFNLSEALLRDNSDRSKEAAEALKAETDVLIKE